MYTLHLNSDAGYAVVPCRDIVQVSTLKFPGLINLSLSPRLSAGRARDHPVMEIGPNHDNFESSESLSLRVSLSLSPGPLDLRRVDALSPEPSE